MNKWGTSLLLSALLTIPLTACETGPTATLLIQPLVLKPAVQPHRPLRLVV